MKPKSRALNPCVRSSEMENVANEHALSHFGSEQCATREEYPVRMQRVPIHLHSHQTATRKMRRQLLVGSCAVVFVAAVLCLALDNQGLQQPGNRPREQSLELAESSTSSSSAAKVATSRAQTHPSQALPKRGSGTQTQAKGPHTISGDQLKETSAQTKFFSPSKAAGSVVTQEVEHSSAEESTKTVGNTIAAVVDAMVGRHSPTEPTTSPATEADAKAKAAIPPKLTKELSHVISKIVQDVVTRKEVAPVPSSPPTSSQLPSAAAATESGQEAKSSSAAEGKEEARAGSPPQEEHSQDSSPRDEHGVQPRASAPLPDGVGGSTDAAQNVTEAEPGNGGGKIEGGKREGRGHRAFAGGPVGQAGPVAGLEYKPIPLTYLAWFVAAISVVLTMVIATTLIVKHLDYYENPHTQKYVVRILFMAPIYAVDSLLALTFVGWTTTYIDVFRDCYEAFTIYNFFKLLVVLLGDEKAVIGMMAAKPQHRMLFPLCCVDPWDMGAEMFYGCKYGALQYVLVKPTCAIVTFVSGAAGLYGARTFSLARLHFYVFFFSNTSQVWALYCLFTFYQVLKAELAPHHPVLKFVIVKAVVFFCFWQGVGLGIMAFLGYVPSSEEFSSDSVVEAIQELLVCIEMVIVSILFHFAFPVEEFADVNTIDHYRQQQHPDGLREHMRKIRQNVSDPFKVADIRQDIQYYGSHTHEQLYGAVAERMEGLGAVSSRFSREARASTPLAGEGKPPETVAELPETEAGLPETEAGPPPPQAAEPDSEAANPSGDAAGSGAGGAQAAGCRERAGRARTPPE